MKRLSLLAVLAVLAASPSVPAQETDFFWDSHILQRTGTVTTPQGTFREDTTRFDMTIPLKIGGLVVRGAGQIFAPRHFWRFYDPFYNGDSANAAALDQDYVDQFKGVQRWRLDTIAVNLYHNSNNVNPGSPGRINFYRVSTDYRIPRNGDEGLSFSRAALDDSNLIEAATYVFDETGLLNTINENGGFIRTIIPLTQFGDEMTFGKEESVMMVYINDFATPVEQPIGGPSDIREWQRFIGYMEFQTGDSFAAFRDPIPRNMVHGVILRSENGMDTISSAYRSFSIGSIPYLSNFDVLWDGVVELDATDLPEAISGVEYRFGSDATDQGLAAVTPNPVQDEATIRFSLTRITQVTLELYTADGRYVETLMKDKKYVEGQYSVRVKANDLASGSYLVRMTADDKAYSMKFVVTK